jgi:hypothetical protein
VRLQPQLRLAASQTTLVNKVGGSFKKENQHTENYLDGQLIALFTFNNFSRDAGILHSNTAISRMDGAVACPA